MKRIILRLTIALLTFALGVTAAAFRLIHPLPQVERQENTSCCLRDFTEPHARRRAAPDFYFPVLIFPADNLLERNFVEWYSGTLAAMREPPFSSLTSSDFEAYRFLWLRSFHPPVSIRIWRHNNEYCMTVKQLDSVDRYIDGRPVPAENLVVNSTRPLSREEWTTFKQLLDGTRFWELPTFDVVPLANDGAFWMLEGVANGRHHFIDRQSPEHGAFYEACVYLLRRSNISIDESKHELY